MISGVIISKPCVVKVNKTKLTQFLLLTDEADPQCLSVITYNDIEVHEGQSVNITGKIRERRFIYNGEGRTVEELIATNLTTK